MINRRGLGIGFPPINLVPSSSSLLMPNTKNTKHKPKCPECGKPSVRVLDSRYTECNNSIRRRRECKNKHRWTTDEITRIAKQHAGTRCPHCRNLLTPQKSASATLSIEHITCPKGHYSRTTIIDTTQTR